MASAVYLCNHSALEEANECRAEGWPEATARVHLNEGLVGRGRHWATDFWDCRSCWSGEEINVCPFYPLERCIQFKDVCSAAVCLMCTQTQDRLQWHDMPRCRNMSDNSHHNEHIRHCSLHPGKATRLSSLWTTMNSTSKCWYGRKRADGSCLYLFIFHY